MRVAINCLAAKKEGALTYLLNLLPKLVSVNPKHEFILYTDPLTADKISKFLPKVTANVEYILINRLIHPIIRIIWENLIFNQYLKNSRIDVLFCPVPPRPLFCSVPTAVAIRNMEPYCLGLWKKVSWFERIRFLYLRFSFGFSLHKATRIVLVAKETQALLEKKHHFDKNKISVIHHGRNKSFRSMKQADALAILADEFNIKEPYILYVSKTRPYKNHVELVEALSILQKRWQHKDKLVIVGDKQEPYYSQVIEKVVELQLEESVIFLGNIDYDLLPIINNGARVAVFPSTCEACPNIVIETLACGVPMAVSNIAVHQEICEDAVLYFDPFEPESIALTMHELLIDKTKLNVLSNKALLQAEKYSWESTAKDLLSVLEQSVIESFN
jgi:glycosyltransferase involved in cell wall biosynthesis